MKRSIGKKLVLSYLILILVTLAVSGILFTAFIKQYMVAEAKTSLRAEANRLMELIGTDDGAEIGPLKKRVLTQIALNTIDSDFFVVQRNNQEVVYSSSRDIPRNTRSPIGLASVFEGKDIEGENDVKGKEIVYVALPVYSANKQQVTRALVLFAELQQIRNVTHEVVMVLLSGFAVTAAVMLVISYFMMRSVTRPLQVLRQAVARLAKRDFTPPEIVKTGDELEELSAAFRQMTLELQQYVEGQRRFLQNASHELKTPLMAIQGYAEGIRDGIFQGADAEKGLDVISSESKRLKKLVDELIYLSKLETLDEMYRPVPVDVQSIVLESAARVESLAQQKGVHIAVEGEAKDRLPLDPDKMIQAFINLLGNGIRHAAGQVTVRLRQTPDRVRVMIEDDGPGFREGEKSLIFERFYHGAAGDTGLGLAITRAIIEKSGGTIQAANRAGGGAVFTVDLRKKPETS